MKLQEISKGAVVILQLLVEDNIFSFDANVLKSDGDCLILDFDMSVITLHAIPAACNIGYVTEDNQFIIFEDVNAQSGLYNSQPALAVTSTSSGKYTDRRMFQRFVLNIPCVVTTEKNLIANECKLRDLSRYGAAIETRSHYSNKDDLHLTFYDKINKVKVSVDASVIRKVKEGNTYIYGLELKKNQDVYRMVTALQDKSLSELSS